MSLINDALKKAKQSQSQTPPAGGPPLTPVEPPPSRGGGPVWILWLAVVLFVAATVLFFRHSGKTEMNSIVATNAPEPAIAVTEPAPAPVQTNSPAAPATNAVEVVERLPKVQGIFYDPGKPWAIVNRQTVHQGDQIGKYKIKTISRDSVSFQRPDGSIQEIKIGGQ